MAKKSCGCSRFFSCFCCASSDVEAPSVGSSSYAVEEGNADVDLDALIDYISQLLEPIKEGRKSSQKKTKTAQRYLPTTSTTFNKLRDFLSEATNFVKDITPGDAIKTVASGILQGMGMAHLVTTGLVVVAAILERFDDVGANKIECLRLLQEMIFLAKLIKQFQERPLLKEGMDNVIKEATELILESSIKCLSQMKSSKFSKFFSTSANKEDLERFTKQLDNQYKHINAQMGIAIFDVHSSKNAPLSRRYPDHAVGLEDSVKEVIHLLEWASDEKAVAIILHGFGGMGKTTLADAVFSLLDLKGCKYSKVQLFKYIGFIPDIVNLQSRILKDLMEPQKSVPDIRTPEDGQRELDNALQEVTALIYIDNVLDVNALRQLLPHDMSKSKKVRLLITTRDLNVRNECPAPMKVAPYPIRGMSSTEAMNLLQKEMSNGTAAKLKDSQLHHMIEICGGIPLMLTLVGGVIRSEENKQKAYRIVMQDRQKLKGQTFGDKEHYLFAYDYLPDTCRDPFLDICSFFNGWDWNTVKDIVGESELDVLEKRALVTKNKDGMACVHDVILTIGLQKTEGTRFKFTSASEVDQLLNEEQGNQPIKGIWLSDNKDPLHINISKLDSMHSSLRVLALGSSVKVEGKSNKVFEKLAFFQAGIPHLPFHMSKVKELRYLSYHPETLDLPEISSNLKHLELHGRLQSHATEISLRDLRQLPNLRILRLLSIPKLEKLPIDLGDLVMDLEELSLSHCESLEELPRSISRLRSLSVLRMDYCSRLQQLPEEFSELQSLRVLRMDYCSSLEHLTEDFGLLNSLQELNLQGCEALQALPNNFENLSSLKLLNLSSCTSLEELPHGLGNLTSLTALDLNKCDELRSIPESIGQLQLLSSSMDMSDCSSLTELPDAFCDLSFLTHLSMARCESLDRLPDRFGKLASLRVLNLQGCQSLEKLPEGFGLLEFLEDLNISSCRCLKKLPEDFHCLVSLQRLLLCSCESLRTLPEDFHLLASLHLLHLDRCSLLEGKCIDNVIRTKTLRLLDIVGSTMLLERWAEIKRDGNQSWSFTVYTGQDLSEEEVNNMQKTFLSNVDGLLIYGQGKPFHLSNCPANTSILVILDQRPNFNFDFPWPLIEETLNDIEIKFEMIYIGKHFEKLPGKVANKILGHAPLNTEVKTIVGNLAGALKLESVSVNNNDYFIVSVTMMGDGKDGKYLSGLRCLCKHKIEEFVVGKCEKYIRLKKIVKASQESNTEILREMFTPREEDSTDHIFQKNCASHKARSEVSKLLTCGVYELKGKTILLEIRHVEVCYDIRLESLTEMYVTAKERPDFEIISIPIVQPGTKVDVSDIFQRFSREVPWLVLREPRMITTTVKYFLVKHCAWEEDEELETWYPSIIWIIEPNGRITIYKPSVLSMLDRWGAKSFPFADEKIKELRKEEWEKQKNMSSLEFLFIHSEKVSKQVKEILLQRKMICLYGGNRGMIEFTCSIRAALTELRDSIHIIYIPTYGLKRKEKLWLTYGTSMKYSPLEKPDMSQAEMEGMPLLNLSEHEAMRFWTRLSSLEKEINEMDNTGMQLRGLKRLLHSLPAWGDETDTWMILMDKDGEMVTGRGEEIVHKLISRDVTEGKEKGLLLQGLLHEFEQEELEKERRYQLLREFEQEQAELEKERRYQLLREFEQQESEERRFSEEAVDKEEQREIQKKIEPCNSEADSITGDPESESKNESDLLSAKASPTTRKEAYVASSSSSAPNATHDNNDSQPFNAPSPVPSS